jgi:hypothetical protein
MLRRNMYVIFIAISMFVISWWKVCTHDVETDKNSLQKNFELLAAVIPQ